MIIQAIIIPNSKSPATSRKPISTNEYVISLVGKCEVTKFCALFNFVEKYRV
jgi:hypothetical protein